MRTAFFGTPSLAVPALEELHALSELVGVVCQPDRPAGRGLKPQQPAVKTAARRLGLEVHQPLKVRTGTLDQWLTERRVDAVVVLAYGRILPRSVLVAPPLGCINLHASLLPRWRGAAPIQWALMAGDTETGVSLMQMNEELDAGPVFSKRTLPIVPDDDVASLCQRLSELCRLVVREDLPAVLRGEVGAVEQDESLVTLAPPLVREHCVLDWTTDAAHIANLVRGLSPRPGTRTWLGQKCFRIVRARALPDSLDAAPGSVHIDVAGRALVATGRGTLEVLEGQVEGRRVCTARDLVNGRALRDGSTFQPKPTP